MEAVINESPQNEIGSGQENEAKNIGSAPAAVNINGNSSREGTVEKETQWTNLSGSGQGAVKPFNIPPPFRGRGGIGSMPTFGRGANRGGIAAAPARTTNQIDSTWPPNANGLQLETWMEAKTPEGKSYYYHSVTRETTWTKPDGPNIRVMTVAEVEELARKQQMGQGLVRPAVNAEAATQNAEVSDKAKSAVPMETNNAENTTSQAPAHLLSQPPPTQQQTTQQTLSQPPPNVAATGPPQHTQQPPPALHQQPPPFFQPGMHPPNFQQPPFGMPPPGYGGYPNSAAPWGMPWNQHMHAPPVQQEKPAKSLIIKPGVIDPAVIARAAEWSEHRAPDGRPYYYHAGRGESVWDKPQALRDMEAARMAAHSGVNPQQATAPITPSVPPHMMPNPLMHMPPAVTGNYDPSMAYNAAAAAAVAAAASKANEAKAAQAINVEKETKKAADEKRKKEEEQKKAPPAAVKPVDKSRPISSTPIAGTPWCVVWTGDSRVFYYNPSSRTSVWERPEELLDREDVDKAVTTVPEQLKAASAYPTGTVVEKTEPEKKPVESPIEENVAEDEDDEIIKIRDESESSVEEVPTKKARIVGKSHKKADASQAAAEAEVRAAKERALVPLETRVKQFREMLREKDVSAFSTWEKELHKIVFDPRYLLLTSKERKQVFEKYVKDRAEEERKEKRNKMRQKRDEFRKLMEDAKLHGKSSFSDFCQRYGKDDRYKAIEKVRERESLFNEFIVDVRRREKEEKLQKKEQIRLDFIDMLRERCDFDRHTRWHEIKKKFESDSRYRAVENSMYREEYFEDFLRMLKDEKRKQKEQKEREREKEREKERERERERKSERKSDKERKNKDRKDRSRSRDKERSDKEKDKKKNSDKTEDTKVKREKDKDKDKNEDKKKHEDSDPEDGQNSDEGEHQNTESDNDEEERLRKERERQLRAELSIREREKEVQRTLAGHLRDRDKEREHHKRDEAIGHFNALLTDLVRNADLTWKEVKRQLRKDHRWELIESLDREIREKIFNEHIESLVKKKREKFREMLDEIPTLELTSSWKDIKKLIKDDPRYLKYNSSDKCEREFRDYVKDKTINAKTALRELLQECKLITHKTSELVKENPHHLNEIEDILRMDKRYLILEHLADERTSIIVSYLEELNKRGPPPPPTASESTRRNK